MPASGLAYASVSRRCEPHRNRCTVGSWIAARSRWRKCGATMADNGSGRTWDRPADGQGDDRGDLRRQGLPLWPGRGGLARLDAAQQLQRRRAAARECQHMRESLPPRLAVEIILRRARTWPAGYACRPTGSHRRGFALREGALPTGSSLGPVRQADSLGLVSQGAKAAPTHVSPASPNRWNSPRTGDLKAIPRQWPSKVHPTSDEWVGQSRS